MITHISWEMHATLVSSM